MTHKKTIPLRLRQRLWTFYACNGDCLGRFTYTLVQIREHFPLAYVLGSKVYLHV